MVDSSSSSAGSSFRELDDVFLQTQTRIWLGEVLGTRLDEDLPITDLLQDGEILFEVAKVLWNLLLTRKELKILKQKFRPFGSKKISGRYRPYSNIDSFLKICKILGLSGIDLFSPSDVVEKKNIRKVCICIRALSKKARSKLLTVPDFNVVRYSVPMSTDMVGVLRRSLESPQCSVSSSSSYTPRKGSVTKSKQKKLSGHANRDDDLSSDESDEAESRYMGENALSPAGKLNYGYQVSSDQENSPEAHSISRHRLSTGNSDFNDPVEKDCSVVGDSSYASVGENNYISEYLAFSDLMVHANNGDSPVILDGEKNMFDFFLNIDSQETGKRNEDDDLELSSTTSMSSVLGRLLNLEFDDQFDEDELSGENIYSHELKEHETEEQHGDSFVLSEQPKIDTLETQPYTVLDQEVQSKLAPGVLLASMDFFPSSWEKCELSSPEPVDSKSCSPQTTYPDIDKGNATLGTAIHGSESDVVHSDSLISNYGTNDVTFSCDSQSVKSEKSREQLHNVNIEGSFCVEPLVVFDGTNIVQEDTRGTISDNHSCLPVKGIGILDNNLCIAGNGSQDNREQQPHVIEENSSDGKKDSGAWKPPGKRRRRLLLETVVKGTAIAGVLFLLLQIRKIKGDDAQGTQPQAQLPKKNGKKSSFTKPRIRGIGKGAYPTDRIRL